MTLRPFLTVTHKVTLGPSLWVCEWDPPSLWGRKVRPHFVNSLFDQKFSRSSAELCESQSRVSQSWTPSLRSRYKMRSRHILTSAEYISLFIFVAHNVFQCQVILALHGGCSSEFQQIFRWEWLPRPSQVVGFSPTSFTSQHHQGILNSKRPPMLPPLDRWPLRSERPSTFLWFISFR